jgi:hypothetical protein
MRGINPAVYLIGALVIHSCAQIGTPGGGPKDATAPKIKKSTPQNFSTAMQGSSIELAFDEYITLKSPKNEVLISPPLQKSPEYKLKGKKLYINWEEPLKENTTYTINLGQAVVDLHEGNPLDSNLFVFSTGNTLDSGNIQGIVTDAFTGKGIDKASVILYTEMRDSTPALELPFYYTRTDKDGNFRFSYLRQQPFFLFALDDKNGNYKYDLPNERLAFDPEHALAGQDSLPIDLRMFTVANNKQYIQSFTETEGRVSVVAALPMNVSDFIVLADTGIWQPYHQTQSVNSDTFTYWTIPAQHRQQLMCILRRDTVLDTLRLTRSIVPMDKWTPLRMELVTSRGKLPHYKEIQIKTPFPVLQLPDTASAHIITGGDTLSSRIKLGTNDPEPRTLTIEGALAEDAQYRIIISDSIFRDARGVYNDSLDVSAKSDSPLNYSALNLSIKGLLNMSRIVELLDEKGGAVQRFYGADSTVFWDFIPPGKYQLRLTLDTNGNGKWDTGTFIPRRQPEKVFYYQQGLEFKEGWDQEIEWILGKGF